MITGFNTDIEHGGVTYHVQTEDKGLAKPIILSLVYDRGTILASKRLPYDDLLKGEFDERVLSERLSRQHKLICAAIKAGRIEDLKKMSSKEPAAQTAEVAVASPALAIVGTSVEPSFNLTNSSAKIEIVDEIIDDHLLSEPSPILKPDTEDLAIPIPDEFQFDLPPLDFSTKTDVVPKSASSSSGPLIEAVSIIEDVYVIPANAVEIVTDADVFSEVPAERPVNDKLSIELLGDVSFKGGDRKTVSVMVCRGSDRKVVSEAQIMVKIIGSNFRPVIFHAATDGNGIAKINLQIPKFKTGRAAFLVRAMSGGEELELRRPIVHGY